jgi:hypothetical protein
MCLHPLFQPFQLPSFQVLGYMDVPLEGDRCRDRSLLLLVQVPARVVAFSASARARSRVHGDDIWSLSARACSPTGSQPMSEGAASGRKAQRQAGKGAPLSPHALPPVLERSCRGPARLISGYSSASQKATDSAPPPCTGSAGRCGRGGTRPSTLSTSTSNVVNCTLPIAGLFVAAESSKGRNRTCSFPVAGGRPPEQRCTAREVEDGGGAPRMRLPSAGQCTRAMGSARTPARTSARTHARPQRGCGRAAACQWSVVVCSCSALGVVHAPNPGKRARTLSDAHAQMRPRMSDRFFWFIQCC